MYLPNKFVTNDQALLTVGGQVLINLSQPRSVSGIWEAVKEWRMQRGVEAPIPFWWFSLALDGLFTIGAVELVDGLITRRTSARVAD